jgi:hypothetical protein
MIFTACGTQQSVVSAAPAAPTASTTAGAIIQSPCATSAHPPNSEPGFLSMPDMRHDPKRLRSLTNFACRRGESGIYP